ncbi:MAG: sulfite exporter TauE/SafE family protein [Candidatus Aminicenantes bacterium]|nr:MAG: sulfite exporter TauE/SafE family protein [Candidatus Aminicenantes bacterium]
MAFPYDLLSVLLAFGISVSGAVLQGSVGFGLGLIGVPLLVLIDPVFVPGPLLLGAFLLNLLISSREKKAIDFKGVKWAIPGRVFGATLGALMLNLVPKDHLSLLFGAMVLLAVGIAFAGLDFSPTSRNVLVAGTLSGFMGTTSAIGGAPMALVFQKQKGSRIRGTLSMIFTIGTIISMASLLVIGRFGIREVQAASVLFPGIIVGFILSRHTARILDRGFIRAAVLITAALSGMFVILKNFF